jgi:hypothetical protein
MACCGHSELAAPQPWVWNTPLVAVGATVAGNTGPRGSTQAARSAETAAAALGVLRNSISVDVHSHGGSTGITSKAPPSGDLANAMRAGSMAVACLADVPDWLVLGRSAEGPSLWCERRHRASSTGTTATAFKTIRARQAPRHNRRPPR